MSIKIMISCYTYIMNGFGEKIKELRQLKGWSQKTLAEKIEQAQSAIVYWERNECEPTISSLKRLCEVFDVSADYLLGLTDGY